MTSIVYVTTNEVSIGCTFSSTEVIISNLQGPQGAPGVVQVTAPLTLDDPTDTIGINSTSGDVASYVVQRDANQRFSIGAIDWDRFSTQSSAEARLYWDGNQTLNLGLGGGNVTIALGQEVINYVTNAEATTLNVGEVVYLFGASGDRPSVKRASNTSDATSAKTFGIVAEAITAGGAGFVVKQGICAKINTLAYNPGDILWLSSTPGQFTTTKPVAPNHLVFVGVVLRSNAGNGLVYVSPQNGFELYELHDVLITTESDGQYLVYEAATDLWKNKSISATAPAVYNASTQVISVTDASTSAKGVVRLSSSTDSTSEVLAATPKAVKDAYDLADAAAPGTTTISATAPITSTGTLDTGVTIGVTVASTSAAGVVQLTDSTSSTSTTTAATPNSVKTAYDLAAAAIPLMQKAAANGVATLDASGLVPTNQLPALAITNTFVVASQAAMLALTAETGDVAVRTDLSKSFILTATPPSTLANWQELLTPPDAVSSVDGRTGTVTLSDLYAARSLTISTTAPLSGGGDLSANRTLSIADASTTVKGAVQLTDSISSTSTTTAATPNSVKTAYDLAAAATPATRTISTTAPLAGGGDLSANRTLSLNIGSSLTTSSNNLIVDSTIVPYLANANTFTAAQTATSFIVTGSTVPTNGIYLPAANTLGLATNSIVRMQIDSTGNVVIGGGTSSTVSFALRKNPTGGTTYFNMYSGGTIQSDVTNAWLGFQSEASTAAATFTLGTIVHFDANQSTLGLNSSVSFQYGFRVRNTLTGAGNNFGFYSDIASAANRWNFYANGTAANYFAGQTTVGSTSLTLGSGSVAQQFGVVAGAATTVGAVIRGAASQTANLFEIQSSSSTNLVAVNSFGQLRATGAGALINAGGPTNVSLFVDGAASQSNDLQQFRDSSGNILNSIDNSGNIRSEAQLIQYGAEGSTLQNIPTRVHPAETLLKQAVWWIDAAHTSASSQTINNLGWGGSALNVTNGSSTSADSNDAQYLAWDGTNYVYVNSNAGNFLSVPSATAIAITGDIDLRVFVNPDSWNSGAQQSLISRWSGAGSNSYLLRITTTGFLTLFWTTDGSTTLSSTSTVATGIVNGTAKWIRVTLDVDNGLSGRDVKFFTSDDGVTWTQLGATVTTAGTTSIFAGTANLRVGADDSQAFNGKIFRAQVLNGIDGVPVLDVDTSVITSGSATSFTALTGQTVTVNRSTSGRKTVCVTNPLWLFGTDDYMEVNNRWLERTTANYLYLPGVNGNYASSPDSAALDVTGDIDIRVKVALDDYTPATNNDLLSKFGTGQASYAMANLTGGGIRLLWNDGTGNKQFNSQNAGLTDGSVKWIRATLDVDNGAGGHDVAFYTSDDGVTWTQVGTTQTGTGITSINNSTAPVEIGSNTAGTGNIARGKFFRAQVLNGINGTVAFDANFETGITSNLPTTFTESSANAATVTVNYSGTGYRSAGVIASTYVYPGNPNTFKLSTTSLLDFGATDSFTAFLIMRQWTTPPSFRSYLSKRLSSTSARWNITSDGTSNGIYTEVTDVAGTTVTRTQSLVFGGLSTAAVVGDRSAQTLQTAINGTTATSTSISTIGSLVNAGTLKIAANPDLGGYADLEVVGAAIWRRALTAREIATLNNYFQGRVA